MTAKTGVLPLKTTSAAGTVTSFSFTDLNGFTGVVTNPTTTPNLTIGTNVTGILYGNGTGVAAAVAGDFPTLNQNTTGSAATLTTSRNIAITGDLAWNVNFNGSANVTAAGTLATVNGNVGSFGSATQVGTFTVNAKGLITAAANATVTPAVGSITGLGTGIATALGVNVGSAGAPVLFNGAAGTPSSLTLTNATGLDVAGGGTGVATLTAYAPIFGGTTGTGAVQSGTAGTAGHVLTSNGAGALPTFQAPAGGGAWTLLSTVQAAASSTIDIETTFDSTYDFYVIVASGVRTSANNTAINALLKVGGAYKTTDYNYHNSVPNSTAATYSANSATAGAGTLIQVLNTVGDTGNNGSGGFVMNVYKPAATNALKAVDWRGHAVTGTQEVVNISGAGVVLGTVAALTGVRFQPGSGTIPTGSFRLYGVSN